MASEVTEHVMVPSPRSLHGHISGSFDSSPGSIDSPQPRQQLDVGEVAQHSLRLPQGFTPGFLLQQRRSASPIPTRSPTRHSSSPEHGVLDSPSPNNSRGNSESQHGHIYAVPAAGAAWQHKSASPAACNENTVSAANSEPLPAPDACEGPEVAAEYEAYMQRWAAGNTLAQRWTRLEASGKAVLIKEGWEEHQLDMLLLQHCSGTPQAAAVLAAWPESLRNGTRAGTPRGKRRSREEAGGDTESPPTTRAHRVRARTAPKMLQDFFVECLPSSQDCEQRLPAATAAGVNSGAAAATGGNAGAATTAAAKQEAAAVAAMELDEDTAADIILSLHRDKSSAATPEPAQAAAVPAPQNSSEGRPRRVLKIKLRPGATTQQQKQQQAAVQATHIDTTAAQTGGPAQTGGIAGAAAATPTAAAVSRPELERLLIEARQLLQQINARVEGNAFAQQEFATHAAKFADTPQKLVQYMQMVRDFTEPGSVQARKRTRMSQLRPSEHQQQLVC